MNGTSEFPLFLKYITFLCQWNGPRNYVR